MEKTLIPKGKKGWIQKAVNPEHKGYCTPMTKATCTPRRKAFAMTMKKHHGFHKRDGGELGDSGAYVPMSKNGNKLLAPKSKRELHGTLSGKDRLPHGKDGEKYPMVKSSDFAGSGRSYPIPTEGDARDAMFLAKIHKRPDVIAKIHSRYPNLK